ncbi:Mating-type switching protein swi10, partial [Tolypocladium capitatum]
SSILRVRPVSTLKKRVRTLVHEIGQQDKAVRLKDASIKRTSSVSTIAMQYRELVDYPGASDIPDVPPIHPQYAQQGLSKAEWDAMELHFPDEFRGSGLLESPWSRLTPSLLSNDGTLAAFEEDAIYPVPLSFLPPVPEQQDFGGAESEAQAPATLGFQLGLELLTRELSSALSNQSSRDRGNASGLQV